MVNKSPAVSITVRAIDDLLRENRKPGNRLRLFPVRLLMPQMLISSMNKKTLHCDTVHYLWSIYLYQERIHFAWCRWAEIFLKEDIFVAWGNSCHFAAPSVVFPRNDIWGTSAEIPYWWRVTTQIWAVLLIGWSKFPSRYQQSEVLPRFG